ncbi:MAG: ATP-binding protein [Clostridia bacterium]|nr:ATP-binding protein [Clostridia bacterium]
MLNYYRQEAIDNDIELNWNIDIPDNSRIQEVDMCSVLGNILENAVDGCKTLTKGRRYFNLTVEPRNGSLYIVTTNNFGEKLKKNGKDYLSTKHSGRDAIGLKSIRSIVEIYNGVFEAKNSDSDFYINALMKYV